ncbi:SUMF1/EgtB/PvdO family nonheme iron enzyme [Aquincola sp. S2]|uniref:SUMF1/EgtB/PvdO family nonheme iron enzyme n=2 Tax=Pseudaquabacterium terrae TaxID=2732868 RepID=A0ABX2EEA3_9BURK|nr:SUMF1/EgtB/PvdO family nonheme iron enzyme [Aquabacterium terrae]
MRRLMRGDEVDWLERLADTDAPLAERWLAGQLLALAGDPRLKPLAPPMVDVAGGEFTLGLEPQRLDAVMDRLAGLGLDRAWIAKECPAYRVRIPSFRIGRYPVTNHEYRVFLLATGHPVLPTSWELGRYPLERANHPVHSVDVASAEAYTAWLSASTGRRFRLPTEAEWELAAGGPAQREYPWGETFEPDRCNTVECGLLITSPVGMFPRGAARCGAQDMAGNVEELVATDYAPYPGGQWIDDHLVQLNGRYRVARGGSFARFRDLARCKRRHGIHRTTRVYVAGFRLAEELARA